MIDTSSAATASLGSASRTRPSCRSASRLRITQCCTGKVRMAALIAQKVHSTEMGANASAPSVRVPTTMNP